MQLLYVAAVVLLFSRNTHTDALSSRSGKFGRRTIHNQGLKDNLLHGKSDDSNIPLAQKKGGDEKGNDLERLSRRDMFEKARTASVAAMAASVGLYSNSPPSYAATTAVSDFDKILSQENLLANLASAPVRTVVITGGNSGVGLSGAKLLTAAGHNVILVCRTKAKADAAAEKCKMYAMTDGNIDAFYKYRREGGSVTGYECDLSSLKSINAFASSLISANTIIDTLVLNAGLAHGQGDTAVYRTADGFEETVGVNHLGHFYLTNLLAPTLASQPQKSGRLVSTASPVHDPNSGGGDVGKPATLGSLSGLINDSKDFSMVDGGPYDADKAYKDSKLCNVLFVLEAARRYNNQFTVNAFSPGLIADPSGFFRNQNKGFATVFNKITKTLGVAESNEFGGSALAFMAVDPSMDKQTGGWYDSAPPGKHQLAKHLPSNEAQNVEEQTLLWTASSKVLGI